MFFAQIVVADVTLDGGVAEVRDAGPAPAPPAGREAAPGAASGESAPKDAASKEGAKEPATKDEAPESPTAPAAPATPAPSSRATPRDDTTGRPIAPRDETGQPLTSRDETGQRLTVTDETGQIPSAEPGVASPDSFLRPLGPGGALLGPGAFDGDPLDQEASALRPGGTDYRLQLALVEGYNSNVVQTQALLGGPVTRHPSPFTGLDASAELRTWTSPTDAQELRLQLRGQHYTPLDGYSQPDDGSISFAYTGQFTLGSRTVLTTRVLSTLTTVNSSRLSDGPLFQVDPSSQQRVYTLTTARVALTHELAPRWRVVTGADVDVSTTLHDTPIAREDGTTFSHHGLDYVQPGVDVSLAHDVDERNILSARLRYQPTYVAFLLDYSSNPPGAIGSSTTQQIEGDVGFTHAFTERFRALTTLGTLVSSAPPLDEDRRPIISPVFSEEVVYQKPYWLAALNANYTYGSANPRLGFGPSVGGGFTVEGNPFPDGKLRHLAMIANGLLTRAAFEEGPGSLARLSFYAAGAEARYTVNRWLGLMGGYNFRYATFEGSDAYPSLVRHLVFLGLSGYFTTDRSEPTLQTFVSPVTPPG